MTPLDELTGRTVLVTGGAGFVGSHIAERLAPHADVRVLDDLSSGSRENVPDGATLIEGDLRDEDALDRAMEGVDVVFHQAALVSVPETVEHPPASAAINAAATVDLLERARRCDARVVFASSAAVYGQPSSLPIAEDEPPEPESPYGVDKLAADRHVRLYNELYGLPTVALRYFNVYGPRQADSAYAAVIGEFLDRARVGRPLVVHGDGEQTRDFVHVDDVVDANLLAATTDAVGRAYNVGTGQSTSILELAETVRSLADEDVEITHADSRDGDVRHSRADVGRAREVLGFEPTVPLEEGLASLFE